VRLPVAREDRLQGFTLLSRLLFPRSYLGKIVLLTFVCTHVPLVALIIYLLLASSASAPVPTVLLVTLVATLVGTAAAVLGLWLLLTPVAASSAALRAYRLTSTPPQLPTDLAGDPGQLLADIQYTLDDLDATVRRLIDEALRDPLTGAPNRRAFEQQLAEELETAENRGEIVALVALDVDGLKAVNDDWGHEAGDVCLRHLTAALVRHLHGHGWVARWGGDEFIAVIREGAGGAPMAEEILARVEAELAENPVLLPNGEQVSLRASGGVSRSHRGEPPKAVFARADAELYRAKQARRLVQPAGSSSSS
jgi:diguanylate cyclase (GGDEF)-like protein